MAEHNAFSRSYISTNRRTSDWVSRHTPKPMRDFVDPARPPSDTDSAIYSSDSDAESSRSVPPPFVLRFPDGREERVSDRHRSNRTQQEVRSRAASGPVNTHQPYPSEHHLRSLSMHGSSRVPRPLLQSPTTNPEHIKIFSPQRSMTPGTTGHVSSRPTQGHRSRTSSLMAPSPRPSYGHDSSDSSHYGSQDEWTRRYGPPQPISYSHSHPPSRYDMPTRDYSARAYRPHSSSKLPRQSVMGSPSSHMSLLTKENTIANSHSRAQSRGIIEDNWSMIDEDEEWDKEQQRAAYRHGYTPQSSNSPSPTYSRSRTNSSSSRSGNQHPGPKVPVSFLFQHRKAGA